MFVFNTSMKITGINLNRTYQNTYTRKEKRQSNEEYPQKDLPSFGKFPEIFSIFSLKKESLPPNYESRLKQLENLNVDETYAKIIAKFDENQYQRAIDLIEKEVSDESIIYVAQLNDEKYAQAQKLIQQGIIDNNLNPLADNEAAVFSRISDLRNKGIHIDYLPLFRTLNQEQYAEAANLMKKGVQQNISAYLVQLPKEQRKVFLRLVNEGTYAPLAFKIAAQKTETRERTLNLIKQGISEADAIEIAELRRGARKRAEDIIALNAGSANISNLAQLRGRQAKRAKELFNNGVLPEYITDIVLVELGILHNEDFKEYLKKGYSYSTAYAISLLSETELEQLRSIEKQFPEIKELYKDNYDINIVENQITEENDKEAIFSKEIRTDNGTLITLVKTFAQDGTVTESRTEEYKDHSTSSIMRNANRVIRAKYDKFGQISEMLHILLEETPPYSVQGAIYSKASDILPGVFDSVYYDISQFRQDNSKADNSMDFDISSIVTGKGIQLSKASRKPDGSIVFEEKFNTNDCESERSYEVKKDEFGNISESCYSYKITKDDGTVLLDILRRRETAQNGSIYNTINGIEYKLTFDDKEKTVIISDGKRKRIVDFKSMLPYYSKDAIWKTIKNQDVDTLLVIADNMDKWTYCNDPDSLIYKHINEISTGKDESVVLHETGHIKQKENPEMLNNQQYLEAYDNEMVNFITNFAFNEQEFIQYFSHRADLAGSLGYEEFLAEANLLLTTYGSSIQGLKTRSQILSRYFPQTMAEAAVMLGKTSQKSLLE